MRTRKPKKDQFLEDLREGLLAIMKDPKAETVDKLRAAEIGVKLYMVQNKGKGDDTAGKFFG